MTITLPFASTFGPRRYWLAGLLLALATNTTAQAQTATTYAYTGGAQTYTVPAGITAVQVVATGASGGAYSLYTNYSYGVRVQATVAVTPGEVLTVLVGGRGGSGTSGLVAGGYNGGGNGGGSGAGGGASDVRRASAAGSTGDYLTTRNALLVAGGGGGSDAAPATGGNGGTPTGGNGTLDNSAYAGNEGGGASQTAPGSAGRNGNAGSSGTGGAGSSPGSGGAGGYYGGGSSGNVYAGGGGGSSWVRPTGSTGISYSVAAAVGNGAVAITPVATTFTYTAPGGAQTYLVPAGVTAVQVTATGASGGIYSTNTNYSYGARAQATVAVTPGETLTIQVGGQGSNGNTISGITAGGYNGGGAGNKDGAGGGASDVRRASSVGSTGDYLSSRNALLVAGGGGGSEALPATGGSGGTPTGGNGIPYSSTYAGGQGGGASQTAPGSAGSFGGAAGSPGSSGTGGASDAIYYGCGGGGGYYGGGGSSALAGGGGGSSWATATGSTGISYSVAAATGNGAVSITPVPLANLVVSAAGQSIGAGIYNSITVQSGGVGTLTAPTYVVAGTTVASGGVLNDGCQVLSGPGSFTLAAGGTLGICASDGISATGSTGSIQVAGTRSFSTDASYVYNGGSQVTGPGLPATVRALVLTNGSNLELTNSVTATAAATLTSGVLSTLGTTVLTLGPTATLSESVSGYTKGTIQTTRSLTTAGTTEAFGGLGLTLTPSGATLPGSTLVRRTTNTALTGAGSSRSVRRYFDIQPTVTAGLDVALALTVRDDELGGLSASRLRLFKSEDAGANWQLQRAATIATTTASGNQPRSYTASLAGIANFSLWTLGDAANPLPVELTTFTATAEGSAAVRLAWATASEKNSARFEVERSADGEGFAPIGTVAAQGSTASLSSYTFLNKQVPAGTSYYRLRQVDLDGTASYSPVRAVTVGGKAAFTLYPNPAPGGAVTLSGTAPGAAVTVLDALGRCVTTATADATGTARLAGLAPGVYVVRAGQQVLRLAVQ